MTEQQMGVAVDAARAVLDRVDALAMAPVTVVEDALAGTAALSRIVDALQVRLAGLIEERSQGPADQRLCRAMGSRSAKEAVAQSFGIRGRDAHQLLALAAMVSPGMSLTGGDIAVKYPRVSAAIDAGALSLEQARTIVGTLEPAAPRADLERLAWAEGLLVDAATDPDFPLVPELLADQARVYVAAIDPDGVLPADERQRTERSFRIWRERGGWGWRGWSPAEDGSSLKAVVDAHEGPRVKVAFRDTGHDGCSDACGDDCDAGRDVDLNGNPAGDDSGVVDDRTREQKRHDILIGLVRAHAASGDAPIAGGEAPTLVFTGTIDAYNAYLHDRPSPDRTLTIEHTGDLVPIEYVARLACDATIHHAVVNGVGQVLNLGRTERLFNRAQRRALAARDKGCRVPGCGLPASWCEAHHITPWEADGPTDITNGILVCVYHHHEIHAGRLRVEAAGPEPGNWRIVPQLRTTDRYARTSRTGATREAAVSESARAAIASIGSTGATGTGAGSGSTVADAGAGSASPGSLAAAAPPALAVRVPAAMAATLAPVAGRPQATRRPHRRSRERARGVEPRLRALLDQQFGRAARAPAVDLHPPPHIVMRT
ncbi:DUF222 domain-containing protein [Agrococcus sp. KRD186]|uniref:DUF222 domain-containing protein n=1 Tax=Agrococcus sp. KRD186 TaxID=2729730 RepID=UPI0019D23A2C